MLEEKFILQMCVLVKQSSKRKENSWFLGTGKLLTVVAVMQHLHQVWAGVESLVVSAVCTLIQNLCEGEFLLILEMTVSNFFFLVIGLFFLNTD